MFLNHTRVFLSFFLIPFTLHHFALSLTLNQFDSVLPTSHPKALRRFLSLIWQDGLWNLKWSQLGYSRNVLRKNF
ncbi:hypothetical protein K1719_021547 [Acacia pycnantha]|nr:hypothetical protein K1719_021547 [Acacia pycnantha]